MKRKIPLYVFGASGHGKVVAEAAVRSGRFTLLGYMDDDQKKWGEAFGGAKVVGNEKVKRVRGAQVALGIGANAARKTVALRIQELGITLATVIHPSASVASGAEIGEGSYVAPLAVIHVDARIGRGCIVNSGAVVEHDNWIGDWVHLSPRTALGGNVTVSEGVHIGIGASAVPGVAIGEWSTIGAGAVVLDDIPPQSVAVGIPAKVIKTLPS